MLPSLFDTSISTTSNISLFSHLVSITSMYRIKNWRTRYSDFTHQILLGTLFRDTDFALHLQPQILVIYRDVPQNRFGMITEMMMEAHQRSKWRNSWKKATFAHNFNPFNLLIRATVPVVCNTGRVVETSLRIDRSFLIHDAVCTREDSLSDCT